MSIPDDRFPSNGSSTYGASDAIIAGVMVFGTMILAGVLIVVSTIISGKGICP